MKIFIIPAFALCAFSLAAEADDRVKFTKEAEEETAKRAEIIGAEIAAKPEHPWAGEYRMGDGLGVNVSVWIAPDAGYVFAWHGCLGLYDRNYGAVAESNGVIRLSFTYPNERKGFQGIAEEFFVIAWGERRFLIPTDKMADFCNSVNSGMINSPFGRGWGMHLERMGGEDKEVEGFPDVPGEWKKCLFEEPVTAKITAVGATTRRPSVCDWDFVDVAFTADAGADKGVFKGMEFYCRAGSARVTEVGETTSQAVFTRIGDNDRNPPPEVGWELTTRAK